VQVKLPDGVWYEIPLEHMVVKDAVFVPTLQIKETRTLIHRLAKECEISVTTHQKIFDGYLGVMVWRTE
jgi:hypothetical protein